MSGNGADTAGDAIDGHWNSGDFESDIVISAGVSSAHTEGAIAGGEGCRGNGGAASGREHPSQFTYRCWSTSVVGGNASYGPRQMLLSNRGSGVLAENFMGTDGGFPASLETWASQYTGTQGG